MRLPAPLDRLQRRFARAWHERGVTLKAASFAMVGVVNTLIDYSVFLSAYYLLKLPLIPANVLAWLVAVSGSYVMNSYITFAAESGRQLRWRAYGAFVASGVVGVITNTTVLVVASRWLPVPVAKLLAIAASFPATFSLSQFVVFRKGEPRAEPSAECRADMLWLRHGRRAHDQGRHGRRHMRDDENLTAERATFVTHLECSATGARYAADELHNLSRERKPLLVRYDLAGVKKALSKEALERRPRDLWRYRELLPVRRARDIVSLGEPVTPIMAMPRLAKTLNATEILVKDESRLPTGSFKAPGLAVSMAKALRGGHMAMPTNGNAGAALAAYASRAGIKTTVFCPEDTPEVNVREIALQGASVYRVNGLIDDCGKIVAEGAAKVG